MGVSVFTNSMPSGNSLCTFDLGGSWAKAYLVVPTFASASGLRLEVAVASGATYYQLAQDIPLTTTVQCWPFQIPATATSGGFVVPLPPSSFQYFRVRAIDSAPTATVNFSVICSKGF